MPYPSYDVFLLQSAAMSTEMTAAAPLICSQIISVCPYIPPFLLPVCMALLEEYISMDCAYTIQVSSRGIVFVDADINIVPS